MIFSLEMSKKQLGIRMIASQSQLELSGIHYNQWSQSDFVRINETCSRLSNYPIYIDDTAGLTLSRLTAKLKRIKKQKDVKFAVVDFLQLMHGEGEGSRHLQIENIVRGLKNCAKYLAIPIIVLCQLSREIEKQKRRPILSDLKESGAIEESADVVIFIHNPTADEKMESLPLLNGDQEEADNIRELIVAKHRNGRVGTILVYWSGKYTTFENLDYH